MIALCHKCQHKHPLEPARAVQAWADWQTKHAGHDVDLVSALPDWKSYRPNATVTPTWAASSAITVTNLHSLPASATYIAGWESGAIDCAGYLDFRVTAKLATHASNRQAGEIRLYLIGPLDDSTWPDVFDGTESTETPTDTEERDAICRIAASTTVDNTASEVYYLEVPSVATVFGGNLPKKFVIYITGNASTTTTAQLASSGSAVYVTGSYLTVA